MAKKSKVRKDIHVDLPAGVDMLDSVFSAAKEAGVGVSITQNNVIHIYSSPNGSVAGVVNSVVGKKEKRVSNKTEINASNSVVNYKSYLENVSVVLGQSRGDLEPDLVKAIEAFKKLLEKVEAETPDFLGVLAGRLAEFVQEASRPKDQRKKAAVMLSAEGLVGAATAVKDSVPALLATARSIAEIISSWPSQLA